MINSWKDENNQKELFLNLQQPKKQSIKTKIENKSLNKNAINNNGQNCGIVKVQFDACVIF